MVKMLLALARCAVICFVGMCVAYGDEGSATKYSILYLGNGGTNSVGETSYVQECPTNACDELLFSNRFVREDYTFDHWQATNGTVYAGGAWVTNVAVVGVTNVLMAQWRQNYDIMEAGRNFGELALPQFLSGRMTYYDLETNDWKQVVTFTVNTNQWGGFLITAIAGSCTNNLNASLWAGDVLLATVTNGCDEVVVDFRTNVAYRVEIANDDLEEGKIIYEIGLGRKYVDVYFDPCGGVLAKSKRTCTYLVGKPYGELPVVYSNGIAQAGWYTEAGLGCGVEITAESNVCANITTLYAHWPHVVSFDANGGTGTMEDRYFRHEESQKLPENEFIWIGRDFAGWTTNAVADVVYTNGESVAFSSNQCLYAVWRDRPTYWVTFTNAVPTGTGVMTNQLFTNGVEQTLTEVGFALTNNIFLGWTTNAFVTNVVYGDREKISPTNDLLLYAVWEYVEPVTNYFVRFDAGGGSGTMAVQEFFFDVGQAIQENEFERTGYRFDHWQMTNAATEVEGGVITNCYADGQVVTNLSLLTGTNVTLKAVWKPHEYELRLDWNVGDYGTFTNLDCVYDVALSLPSNVLDRSGEGYVFSGWSQTKSIFPEYEDGEVVSNLTDTAATSTLYAIWQGAPYVVHYDGYAEDVRGTMPDQDMVYGRHYSLMRNRFVRLGWDFIGWSSDTESLEVEWEDGARVQNLVLSGTNYCYAVWETNKNVTVRTNTGGENDWGKVSLSNSKKRPQSFWVTGILTNNTADVFKFTPATAGEFRIALDPLTGARCETVATVTEVGEDGASTNVTDVSSSEIRFEFKKNTTYRVEVRQECATDESPYEYVFSIARAGCDVTFNVNGGTAKTVGSGVYGTNFNFSVGAPIGYQPELKAIPGVELSGWYTDAAMGERVEQEDLVTEADAMMLYAHYYRGPYDYLVRYDKNGSGASGTMSDETFSSESINGLSSNRYSWVYHEFQGWALSAADTEVWFGDEEVFAEPLTSVSNGTVTLYAVWKDVRPTYTQEDAYGVTWKYVVDIGVGATIKDNSGNFPAISPYVSGAVSVPEKVYDPESSNDVAVVGIGEYAFSGCTKITSVTIPASVSNIAEAAFLNCQALQSVKFSSDHALAEIPERCFEGCSSLDSIDLPYSITAIGDRAFAGCTSLKAGITIPEHVETMGAYVFTNCPNLKIVRYWGAEPEADGDLYTGTSENLVSGVVPLMWSGETSISSNDSTWCERKLAQLNSKSAPAIRRLKFDPNYDDATVSSDFYIKDHAIVQLPADLERTEENRGIDDNYTVNYYFSGWFTAKTGGEQLTADTVVSEAKTYYAQWEESVACEVDAVDPELYEMEIAEENPLSVTVAHAAAAVVYDADETFKGTVTFSVAKGTGSGGVTSSVVKATAEVDGLTRKFTGTMLNALPVRLVNSADESDTMEITFTANGVAGVWGDWSVQGARDGVSVKGDWMQTDYARRLAGRKWTLSFDSDGELTLAAGADGNVKVTGTVSNETFSTTSRIILGEEKAYLPIQASASRSGGTLNAWVILTNDWGMEDPDDDEPGTRPLESREVAIEVKFAQYLTSKGKSVELALNECEEVVANLGTLSFVKSAVTVKESATFAEISVKRTGGDKGTSAYLAFRAIPGYDTPDEEAQGQPYEEYYPTNGVLCWLAGDTSTKKIRVRLVPDEYPTYEVDQVFGVEVMPLCTGDEDVSDDSDIWDGNVESPTPTFGADDDDRVCRVTVTETDKKQPGTIAVTGYDEVEISNIKKPTATVTANETLTLTLSRTGGSNGAVAVKVTAVKGTAKPDEDYEWSEDVEVEWEDGDAEDKTVELSTYSNGEDYTPTKSLTLKLTAVSDKEHAKPTLAASSVAVTIRNDKIATTLEEYAKTLSKSDGISIKGGKAGQWYFADGEDPLDPDAEREVGDDFTLTSVPMAAGESQTLTFTLTGPGVFTLTPPSIDYYSGVCEVTFGKEKWSTDDEDGSWPSDISRVVPSGSTTVKITVKAKKGEDAEGLDGVGVTWSWIPFGTIASVPADGSVVTGEQILSWDFGTRVAAEDAGITYRLVMDASKSNLTKSPEVDNEYSSPEEVESSITALLEDCQAGKKYYWRLAFAAPDQVDDEGEAVWQWHKDTWSFTVAAEDAPTTTIAYGGEEGENIDSDSEVLLMQGVKAEFQLGSDTEDVTYKVAAGKLPTGLKLNAKTGAVTGVPTKAGDFTTVFQSLAGKVGGITVAVRFKVLELGIGAGTFNAVAQQVEDDGETTVFTNAAALASVTFTASAAGKLSAKVLRAGKSCTFSTTGYDSYEEFAESMDEDPVYVLAATLYNVEKNKSGNITNTLSVTVYAASATNLTAACQAGTVTLTFNAGGDSETIMTSAGLARDNSKMTGWTDLVAPYAGYHTMALLPADDASETAPQGHGYLTATVAAKGTVKYAVVHADGTTGSGSVTGGMKYGDDAYNFSVPLYAYKAKSVFGGTLLMKLQDTEDEEQVAVMDSELSELFRANDDPASTEAGLEGYALALTPVGGWFDTVMNLQGHYAKNEMQLSDGMDVTAAIALFGTNYSGSEDSIRNVTCSLKAATGITSGTFDLYAEDYDSDSAVKLSTLKHQGVVILNRDDSFFTESTDSVASYGFFLVPKTIGSGKTKRTWNGSWAFDVVASDREDVNE